MSSINPATSPRRPWATALAWLLSLAVHAALLITVGHMTLSGGKPSQPGVTEITLNLAALPAPQTSEAIAPPVEPAPVTPPQPKPQPKPQPTPRPAPTPKPTPQPKPVEQEVQQQERQEIAEVSEPAEQSEPQTASSAPQGAQGRPGVPGEGADRQGEQDNLLNRYLAQVREEIERRKQYPHQARQRRQEGAVVVSFQINAGGRVENLRVVESSGSRILDRGTEQMLARLRFAEPPKELDSIPVSVTIPINYSLSNS